MACPAESVLQEVVDGTATNIILAEVLDHLDGCPSCREVVGATSTLQGHGDRVGRYWLRQVIGTGGMGVVYEAFDPELNRIVAVKVLRPELSALQERLVKEAQA